MSDNTLKRYPINEVFCSLQGEGFWSGRPAVFIRFAGCNIRCPFCDTDYSAALSLTTIDILSQLRQYPTNFVVLTGGEPSLYVDQQLINALHDDAKYIAIETNGTHPLPNGIDWVTLSPKDIFIKDAKVVLDECCEIKLVFNGNNSDDILRYTHFPASHHYIQPCDTGNTMENQRITRLAIDFCLAHPQWSLSLQQHKILNIR